MKKNFFKKVKKVLDKPETV
ncbi:hypothetical protein CK3_20170 [butyrate-producing bacterium SS3/4]|nr:hypothetical protein CK3_20170 [butyrate-producing bacterium SS3/4]